MEEKALQGGEFIIKETEAKDIFIPEEFSDDQKMMAETCSDFLDKEIMPNIDQLDKHDRKLLQTMFDKTGELGLLGVSVPEEYEGFGQNMVTSMKVIEEMGRGFSFAVAFSAHTGIATLPILYYGTEEQKKKYLPKLASGEYIGAYCLTESDAGSDPNAGKTKAILSDDGKYYTLNGVKMWITNGGVADVHIVYAKIGDDKNLSAFIVDADLDGIEVGVDEDKMGIQGSSTTQIYYEDVKVPVENLLGEQNKGFKVALNILNLGRIKLGGATIGAAKGVITDTIVYANERKQFKTPIAQFGAIKHKFGQMVIDTFAAESLVYRASQNIDDYKDFYQKTEGMDEGKASLEALRQFAIEASIAKVHCSELLDFVVDEGVQIFGGMGYSRETNVERAYRDSRINRIFEGTNEINRLVMVGELVKRGMKGELDLLTPAKDVAKEIMEIPDMGDMSTDYFDVKKKIIKNLKKTLLMTSGAALQKYGKKLMHHQELMFAAADMMILIYASESMMLRVEKLADKYDQKKLSLYKDMLDLQFYETASKIKKIGDDAINSFATSDEKRGMLMGNKRFTKIDGVNVIEIRRKVADKLIDDNKYMF